MCTVAEPSFMAQYEYNTCTRKVLPKIKTNTAEKKHWYTKHKHSA